MRGSPVPLPECLAAGDWLEFGLAGAYGSATATRFNGFRSDQYLHVRCAFADTAATAWRLAE